MKEIKIEINIRALRYEELDEKDRKLIDAAKEATARSYAPYSHFSVGAAALLANGDSMYSISQKFGVRLERLYKMNNMDPDSPAPKVGDILRLR
jgi:hypothetical protein